MIVNADLQMAPLSSFGPPSQRGMG